MIYKCPICHYNQMTSPPEDWYICPICKTEFGVDDFDYSWEELRVKWVIKYFNRLTKTTGT